MSRKKTDFYELTKRTTFLNVAALSFVCLLGIVYTLYYSNVGKILFHILSVCGAPFPGKDLWVSSALFHLICVLNLSWRGERRKERLQNEDGMSLKGG